MRLFRQILGGGVISLLTACSASPTDPGLCVLNCSKAIITGSDKAFTISLANTMPSYQCATGLTQMTPFAGPIMIQYVLWDAGITVGSENPGDPVPVPNISFDPIVNGALVAASTSPANVTEYSAGQTLPDGTVATAKTYYPYRYLGISTPKTNWCSDSCGVMTLEVVPYCPVAGQTNNVSVQVASGAKVSDVASISITTPTN